jgi:hypothetical protein
LCSGDATLSAQLHPHFLFNALHAVSELISENPSQAITMLNGILYDGLKQQRRHDAQPQISQSDTTFSGRTMADVMRRSTAVPTLH